jgi:hypothetical protein
MASVRTAILDLTSLAETGLFGLFEGKGEYGSDIAKLCSRIVTVVETFLDPNMGLDLTDPQTLHFLKAALPSLTEAFLRRHTER